LLLEVDNPLFEEARDNLVGFAELVKSPEHVHTYRISSLSLWNSVAAGMSPDQMIERLTRYSQYAVPQEVINFIEDQGRRYGKLRLEAAPDGRGLWLTGDDPLLLTQMAHQKLVQPYLGEGLHPGYRIDPAHRGLLKQALAKIAWPADDRAGYTQGAPMALTLRSTAQDGRPFFLRPYQKDAVRSFWGDGATDRGNGVIVLPCGAGKTMVGLGVIDKAQAHTLILTTSVASLHQWREELLNNTSLSADDIGEYTARTKETRPVTLTTYQLLRHRTRG
jgi:DNA excision repair protein ERCC-3